MASDAHPSTTTSASPTRLMPPTRLPTLPPNNRASSSTLSTRSFLSTSTATTPSLLTPNTRAEAEAAFSSNCAYQTDAAAPTTPITMSSTSNASADGTSSSSSAGGPIRPSDLGIRPPFPTRSSTNYFHALEALAKEGKGFAPGAIGVQPLGAGAKVGGSSEAPATLEKSDSVDETEGGQHDGMTMGGPVGGATEPVVNWKPELARQQSWNQQDLHRVMQERLMAKTDEGDMGYDSAAGEKL